MQSVNDAGLTQLTLAKNGRGDDDLHLVRRVCH